MEKGLSLGVYLKIRMLENSLWVILWKCIIITLNYASGHHHHFVLGLILWEVNSCFWPQKRTFWRQFHRSSYASRACLLQDNRPILDTLSQYPTLLCHLAHYLYVKLLIWLQVLSSSVELSPDCLYPNLPSWQRSISANKIAKRILQGEITHSSFFYDHGLSFKDNLYVGSSRAMFPCLV